MFIPDDVAAWIATGERGLSSEAIVGHLTGLRLNQRQREVSVPYDPDDLRRCVLMLEACPSVRAHFDEMRTASPTWARLVDAWPELIATLDREVPGWRGRAPGIATETYAMMQRLLRGES